MNERYIPRTLSKLIKELLSYYPVVVVSGARKVGKSTLLQHLFPEYHYVLFDPIIDIHNAKQDPELFLRNQATPLILDEVQYCPEVVPVIKRWVDQKKSTESIFL